jgi:hypothetical protein
MQAVKSKDGLRRCGNGMENVVHSASGTGHGQKRYGQKIRLASAAVAEKSGRSPGSALNPASSKV